MDNEQVEKTFNLKYITIVTSNLLVNNRISRNHYNTSQTTPGVSKKRRGFFEMRVTVGYC